MKRQLSEIEKKFVQSMLDNAPKSAKIQPESKVDLSEVEQITKNIQRKIQRGE
jgi:hypothetical protein